MRAEMQGVLRPELCTEVVAGLRAAGPLALWLGIGEEVLIGEGDASVALRLFTWPPLLTLVFFALASFERPFDAL